MNNSGNPLPTTSALRLPMPLLIFTFHQVYGLLISIEGQEGNLAGWLSSTSYEEVCFLADSGPRSTILYKSLY